MVPGELILSLSPDKLIEREEVKEPHDRCAITLPRGKVGRSETNLIMIRNLGQQRHPEWVKQGRRLSHVLALATETTAAALGDIVGLNLN